jgi:hypothetical protein
MRLSDWLSLASPLGSRLREQNTQNTRRSCRSCSGILIYGAATDATSLVGDLVLIRPDIMHLNILKPRGREEERRKKKRQLNYAIAVPKKRGAPVSSRGGSPDTYKNGRCFSKHSTHEASQTTNNPKTRRPGYLSSGGLASNRHPRVGFRLT